MNDHCVTGARVVELTLSAWSWMIRFCSVSALWALTAWPIVTIPVCSVAAIKAWQSDDDLLPWRAFWNGFSHSQGSYWIGAPWMLGLLVSAFEITLVMEHRLPGSTVFTGLLITLNATVTIWAIYAWSALSQGFSTIDAVRWGLIGVFYRPLKTVFLAAATVCVAGLAILVPITVPLIWGGGLAMIGSSGTKAFGHPSVLSKNI